MLVFTSAQLDAWINAFLFPIARVLALFGMAPIFSNMVMRGRLRLMLGLAVAFALAPALPPMPVTPAGSWVGLRILAEQMVIGLLLGIVLRIVFAAVDLAGELIGLQMGLSFAMFYDPQGGGQTPVMSEFLGLVTTLLFLAMNGHLLMISVLAESFHLLPVRTQPIAAQSFSALLAWSATLFASGLLLSLPVIAALLIANIAMGVLARVAPQLNLFAVGFPVTLAAGFFVLFLAMPYFGTALERLFDDGFAAMRQIMELAKPTAA